MKVLNIHGYRGSAENASCIALKKLGHEVISPQIDYDAVNPVEFLDYLRKIFLENKPDYIVATSLGGFFSILLLQELKIEKFPMVLVNPCLKPTVTMSQFDYKKDEMTKTILLKCESIIEKVDYSNITAIIGRQDEVISYHDFTEKLIKNCCIVPDGKHSGATLNLDYWLKRLIK